MKKKTLLISLMILLMVGSIFAQGDKERTKNSDTNTITVLMPRHEMDLVGIWESQTKEFEQETGINVEFIQMSWDEVQTKVMTDMAAGGNAYDVIEFDNGWISKFATANWLEPLNNYGTKEYFASLLPGLLNTFTVDNQILGVPWNNDTRFFFYNKTMLDNVGIKEAPKTWVEVIKDSKTLQKHGIQYPIAEYWNQEWALANSVAFYLYSFGTNYFDNEGNITINKPQAVKALTLMDNMINKDKIANPSSITLSQEAAADLFYRGSSAFYFQGPPSTYSYANDKSKSNVVGDIKAAEWLPAEKEEEMQTLTLPEAFAIPKTSKNKDLAWKYISFMISEKKDLERAKTIGSLPLFSDLYENPELLKLYPFWRELGKQSANAKALPLVSWYDELVQTTIVAVQEMMIGNKSPQAVGDEIASFLKGRNYNGIELH